MRCDQCDRQAEILLDDGDQSDSGDAGCSQLCRRHAEQAWAAPNAPFVNWFNLAVGNRVAGEVRA